MPGLELLPTEEIGTSRRWADFALPVKNAVAQDGALLISEDGNGTIWRTTSR
jgi:glucose/arabinose dehydrogenase